MEIWYVEIFLFLLLKYSDWEIKELWMNGLECKGVDFNCLFLWVSCCMIWIFVGRCLLFEVIGVVIGYEFEIFFIYVKKK